MRKDRILIKLARKHFNGRKITALEIGVFNGGNAVSIIKNLNIKKLYLIDPYKDNDLLYNKVKKRIKKYTKKAEFIRDYSNNVEINDTFDLIYFDGDYSNILTDFKRFYPLLNKDGIIGGYAFMPQHRQLVEDVYRIADIYGLKVVGDFNEWWVVF